MPLAAGSDGLDGNDSKLGDLATAPKSEEAAPALAPSGAVCGLPVVAGVVAAHAGEPPPAPSSSAAASCEGEEAEEPVAAQVAKHCERCALRDGAECHKEGNCAEAGRRLPGALLLRIFPWPAAAGEAGRREIDRRVVAVAGRVIFRAGCGEGRDCMRMALHAA